MAALCITFIKDPPFVVDFSQFTPPKIPESVRSRLERIQKCAGAALQFVRIVFVAIGKSAYLNLSYSSTSFKYIVLGYYGNFKISSDITLIAFKIVIWVASVTWCFTTTTGRMIYEKMKDESTSQLYLGQFAGDEIDVSHIQTNEQSIDVSNVPQSVTVHKLLEMFDQINFDKPLEPGFVDLNSPGFREGSTRYTKDNLKKSLQVFIDHVEERIAFLGTPPAADTPRLMEFYQQIEDAVRFSIHKVNSDLSTFLQNNRNGPYNVEQTKKYKDLLEDRARVAINLAIAGTACGARYMGESMELYDTLKGDSSIVQGTLKDCLIELLASKRKEIAIEQSQRHFNSDTHGYGKYMQSLGQILAIPGTKNVIEHLSRNLDRSIYLKYFFEEYTVDLITATVQEKIKKSQELRGKIIDWMRDQVGNWNQQMNEEKLNTLLAKLDSILQQHSLRSDFSKYTSFIRLMELINHLKQQNIPWPNANPEDSDFQTELFQLDMVNGWCAEHLSPDPRDFESLSQDKRAEQLVQKKAQMKREMKNLFLNENLGPQLIEKVKGSSPLQLADFSERLLTLQKVYQIVKEFQISSEIAIRIVKGEKSPKDAILEDYDRTRGNQLISRLIVSDKMATDGLSQELLEWLLVSQKILLPQVRV